MRRRIAATSVTGHQLSIRMMIMKKKYARQVISIEFIKTRKHHLQVCLIERMAMFTTHTGARLTFSMSINLLLKQLSLFNVFNFLYFILFTF